MQKRERAFSERLWRAVVIGLGVLGGFAAFDAVLLFVVLLLSAIFVAAPNAYIGLLMFVALPIAAMVGGAIAWAAYSVWNDRAPASPADEHPAAV